MGNQSIGVAAVQADPAASQTTRKQLEGEVRFLRAYFYSKLVRFLGGVPLIESILPVKDSNNVALQARATRETVYARIVSDLRFATNVLPVKKQTATGKATKAATMAMLAKVYFYRQNYQQAYALTDSIIKNQVGAYSLLPNYASLWRETGANGSELILKCRPASTCHAMRLLTST